MKVLVDTSVWSLALRRRREALSAGEQAVVARLDELLRDDRAALVGPVRQELLSGIREAGQFAAVRRRLAAFPDEPLATADYEDAARAFNACRSRGISASAIDILLCAVALRREWALFTTDPDFGRYQGVLGFALEGVAAPAP